MRKALIIRFSVLIKGEKLLTLFLLIYTGFILVIVIATDCMYNGRKGNNF